VASHIVFLVSEGHLMSEYAYQDFVRDHDIKALAHPGRRAPTESKVKWKLAPLCVNNPYFLYAPYFPIGLVNAVVCR